MRHERRSKVRKTALACMLLALALALPLAIKQPSGAAVVFGAWTELGPRPFMGFNPISHYSDGSLKADEAMSGQPSAIAVDLVNDTSGNTVYVGSSSGGLWKSTNGLGSTPTFVPISDPNQNLTIGAVALDSRLNHPTTIYVGTGDPDNPGVISSHAGTGILISRDDGQTWTLKGSADNGAHPFTGLGFSKIIVDPRDHNVLLAAAGRASDPSAVESGVPQGSQAFRHVGIYRSQDAGETWTRVKGVTLQGIEEQDDTDFHIELHYSPKKTLFMAGISQRDISDSSDQIERGLFASSDGIVWQAFKNLPEPLPDIPLTAPEKMYRVSLAERNGRLWAMVLVNRSPAFTAGDNCEVNSSLPICHAHRLFEVDLSDMDATWQDIPKPPTLHHKGFLMYVAAPPPPSSNTLVMASEFLFRTDDIFRIENSQRKPMWSKIEGSLHGDQHAIAFVNSQTWYVGDDGGAFVTGDRGGNWKSLNADLRTTEFYSASPDSADSGSYIGGQQDNGTSFSDGGSTWTQFVGADGMYTAADPQDSGGFFGSIQFGNLFYFLADPTLPKQGTLIDVVNDTAAPMTKDLRQALLTPYEVLPTDPRLFAGTSAESQLNFGRARILLVGLNNLWLVGFDPSSTEKPVTVQANTGINDVIYYVAPVPGDPTSAYAVTRTRLFRVNNFNFTGSGATVTPITGGPVNGEALGHVAVSPVCPDTLYLIKVGFLNGQKIFKSTDGGRSWANISGNLPNVPLHWVTVDPADPNFIYVGTNVGGFVAMDGGIADEQWQPLGTGCPGCQ